MGWREQLAAARPSGGGNFIKDGKGRLIVKDLKMMKGYEDPNTFVFEAMVKSSEPIEKDDAGNWVQPNPPGQTVSYICQLNKFKDVAPNNMKALILAILGPEGQAMTEAALTAETDELLRVNLSPGPDFGYTTEGKPCIARGIELAFETYRTKTKSQKVITVVKFSHVPLDAAALELNKKALDGSQA